MTTDYRALIENELFMVDGKLYTSLRGAAKLAGVSHTSVRHYVTRHHLETKWVSKPLETALGAGRYVETTGVAPKELVTIIRHYASSINVSDEARQYSADMLAAFAVRGYEAWVSDMLGIKLDNTQSNATINALLQRYPGATFLKDDNNVNEPVTCLEWLAWFMGQSDIENTEELHNWLKPRLPQAAAATYKAMVGEMPYSRIITKNGREVRQYYYYDVAPIMAALDQLIAQWQTSLETAKVC